VIDGVTTLAGIEIPSIDPVFLAVVGIHIPLGLACVIVGALAMLSVKRRGRHSGFGTVYYWCLLALFGSATVLAVMRWTEDYHLFILGALSFALAWFGRKAVHRGGRAATQAWRPEPVLIPLGNPQVAH
jgi:hypothetical protein